MIMKSSSKRGVDVSQSTNFVYYSVHRKGEGALAESGDDFIVFLMESYVIRRKKSVGVVNFCREKSAGLVNFCRKKSVGLVNFCRKKSVGVVWIFVENGLEIEAPWWVSGVEAGDGWHCCRTPTRCRGRTGVEAPDGRGPRSADGAAENYRQTQGDHIFL